MVDDRRELPQQLTATQLLNACLPTTVVAVPAKRRASVQYYCLSYAASTLSQQRTLPAYPIRRRQALSPTLVTFGVAAGSPARWLSLTARDRLLKTAVQEPKTTKHIKSYEKNKTLDHYDADHHFIFPFFSFVSLVGPLIFSHDGSVASSLPLLPPPLS
jgi:hypothetical protein